jgi:hypothetical protein|tara:strand:- start:614 stop:865 length:252 start_codon:yes stop_codon:yes gene_type:complete
MNTSITSSNETANSILTLANTYDNVDISNVSKITGDISTVTSIANSTKFTGFETSNLVITETMTTEIEQFFNAQTSGIVEQGS